VTLSDPVNGSTCQMLSSFSGSGAPAGLLASAKVPGAAWPVKCLTQPKTVNMTPIAVNSPLNLIVRSILLS
jgi:hypothetical protein